jgi:membrane-bound serine protease (ClpP class)
MNKKVTNDAVAKIRNLAEFRGRNADWAESAVREAVNITADQALSLGVIDLVAPDVPTLLNQIDGRQVTMENGETFTLQTANATLDTFQMNLLEKLLQLIADPTIAYLLLSIGSLGIFLELSNPGAFLPGIIGVLALLFGLFGLGTVPVNWTGAILIAVGLALFFVDIYVSSFGTLLIAGLGCFIVGSYLLIDTTVPGYDGVSRPVIWAAAACVLGAAFFIGLSVMRIRRKKPQTGKPALLGDIGVVRQELNPRGMIFVNGELWSARLENDTATPIGVGEKVEILAITGLLLTVKPVAADVPLTRSNVLEPRNAGVISSVRTEQA